MNTTLLRPSPSVRSSISEDGLVLLDFAGGLVLSSNAVGSRIWQLIEEQRTPAQIARQIAEDFDVTDERAYVDVAKFVADLLARGLVVEDGR